MSRPRAAVTHRASGSWTPRIAGISVAVVVALGGAIAYGIASPAGAAHGGPQLSSRVQGVQTVGIISQVGGQVGDPAELRMLSVAGPGDLQFAPIPASDLPQGNPQWSVDRMADDTFIFIYAPTGRCLAAVSQQSRPAVALRRCDLGPLQRWEPVNGAVQLGGNEYGQYRNLGDGRCLGTTGTPATLPPTLESCARSVPVRQLISFYWGVFGANQA
jgi:hypothetical protein